jgi:hypothetical protein
MANKFTAFLTGVANGLTSPKGLMSNWQHATRLFVDDTFRLAPKTKFNYYVNFEVDPIAIKSPGFTKDHINESALLVKTADLPKFQFDKETLNQYNRKKIVYKNINYQPVTMSLHDDNNGTVNALWALYYGYYVKDRSLPDTAYNSPLYRNTGTSVDNFRYGMDNNISVPFLKSITIYTMGRRRFTGYTLINPKIVQWDQGSRDHSDGSGTAEHTMTLEYEAVRYSAGSVSQNSPKGFADLHYDVTPSPLSIAGGGVAQLFGEGGVLDGIETVFGAVGSGTAFDSPGNFLSTVAAGINTYQNAKNLSKESIVEQGLQILSSPGAVNQIVGGISGAVGSVFPSSDTTNTTTDATPKSLVTTQAAPPRPVNTSTLIPLAGGAQTFALGQGPAGENSTFQPTNP